eukprot:TRINITY_DN3666_c0_g1_i2.p1 TRINITY_DN3666_c0_g1~~TRINITY_DN3666_c0_g1_i2.p1  ORF type:complete len:136 (-),score=19.03 TRINITY_DN3666_c0_g1_i2:55-462(-)
MKRLFARTGIFPRNNVRLYSNKHQLRGQEEARLRSLRDPTRFWGEAAKALTWDKPFDNVLSDSKTAVPHRWFTGGKINACYNAIDVHLPTRKNQNALIYDSPVTVCDFLVFLPSLLAHLFLSMLEKSVNIINIYH